MSIKDLYQSGKKKQNIGHYANLVKVAKSNDEVTEEQLVALKRFSRRLSLSESDVRNVFENPEKYPINPPVSFDERIERLYNLLSVIFADGIIDDQEHEILKKLIIGLGFPIEKSDLVLLNSIRLMNDHLDLEDFTAKLKKM